MRNCKTCNKEFKPLVYRVKIGSGFWCSKNCYYYYKSIKYKYRDKEYTLKELADMADISLGTMRGRVRKWKWSIKNAVEKPAKEYFGISSHKIYAVWSSMKQRCNNPSHHFYKNYGGRGIKICKRWFVFKNFYDDMINDYKEGLTLERIDNDGDYSLGNCKWATWKEQANNRRSSHAWKEIIWEHNGVKRTIKEWSDVIGMKHASLYCRVANYGWSVERALTEPKRVW